MSISLALSALLIACIGAASAQELVFETDDVRLVIDQSGACRSLQEKKSRRELLVGAPAPLLSVRQSGKWKPVTRLERKGDVIGAEFGLQGLSADLRIKSDGDRILFEVVQVTGAGVEEVRIVQLKVSGLANLGTLFSVMWDEKFAVGLIGLSDRVNARLEGDNLLASIYPEFGIAGEKVALLAVPKMRYADAVHRVELDLKLPSPTIGGVWAKHAQDTRTSYLFTDLTEANADETIRYAKLAGFKYILIYSHIWSSSLGSYPINIRNFPQGEASLKAVIDKCHAAGIKVGMHMMTSVVGKDDAFTSSRVQNLFSDADEVLAADIGPDDRDVHAQGSMVQFRRSMYEVSLEVRIDNEIIRYETIGGPGATVLFRCTRGYAGTKPAPHKKGAKIRHLAQYFGSYLADLRTPLKDDISDRIAMVIEKCGFDMIFFDGAEANCVNGPCWHWAGQQEMSIAERVKRDLLVEGSGMSHWSWHISTRAYCDDFAAVAPKQYLDHHKIDHWWKYYSRSFMPVELGWWGFLSGAPDHEATTPDEAELYAVRMLALDTPVSMETSLDVLRSNGRTDEILNMLGEYEQLRLSNAVPVAVREKLRSGEWHMMKKDGRKVFRPVRYEKRFIERTGEIQINNEFAPQKLKFRIQAGSALAQVGDRTNIALLPPGSTLLLKKPGPAGASPGMLTGRILFAQAGVGQPGVPFPGRGSSMVQGGSPPNLTYHRALALKVNVDGALLKGGEKAAVLNVQLEADGFFRDHYLNLDFIGERMIIIPEPNTERMLPEFRPSYTAYSMKAAVYGFNYRRINAVNFRWMQQPKSSQVQCTITLVEALSETESSVKDLEFLVGAGKTRIPVTLKTGEYVEYWGDGPARKFDRNGVQLGTIQVIEALQLGTGSKSVVLHREGGAALKLTTIMLGEELTF